MLANNDILAKMTVYQKRVFENFDFTLYRKGIAT